MRELVILLSCLVFVKQSSTLHVQGFYVGDDDWLAMHEPAIRLITEDVFVFQHDNPTAHPARHTVAVLARATVQFIGSDRFNRTLV